MSSTYRTSRSRDGRISDRARTRTAAAVGAALVLALALTPVAAASASPIDLPDVPGVDTGGDAGTTPPEEDPGSTPPSAPPVDPAPSAETPTTPSDPPASNEGGSGAPATGGSSSSGAGSSTPGRSSSSRTGGGTAGSDPAPAESAAVAPPAAGTPSTAATPTPAPTPSSTDAALLPRVTLSGPLGADAAASPGLLGGADLRIVFGLLAAALLAGAATLVLRRRAQRDPAAAGAEAWSAPSETAVFASPLPVNDFPALASWRLDAQSHSAAAAEGPSATADAVDLSPGNYRRAEPPGFFTEARGDGRSGQPV